MSAPSPIYPLTRPLVTPRQPPQARALGDRRQWGSRLVAGSSVTGSRAHRSRRSVTLRSSWDQVAVPDHLSKPWRTIRTMDGIKTGINLLLPRLPKCIITPTMRYDRQQTYPLNTPYVVGTGPEPTALGSGRYLTQFNILRLITAF